MNGKNVRIGACLLVGNLDKMVKFYRDVLGFKTEWDGGNFAEFETANGRTTLLLNVQFPCGAPMTFDFGIHNFYVADPEGNLLEIGSMNK